MPLHPGSAPLARGWFFMFGVAAKAAEGQTTTLGFLARLSLRFDIL